ncbi:hypothetical protein P3S67_004527 [Capsicum chacoense]
MLKLCPYRPNRPNVGVKEKDSQTKLAFLPSFTDEKGGALGNWKFDQRRSRKDSAQMIVIDELSFSFVEKEGFRNFMRVTAPYFHSPSRRTLTRDCYQFYNEEKQILKKVFKEVRPKVCPTIDTWTSIQKINYMCLTAHFIDTNWKLHKRVINFCPISSHKGLIWLLPLLIVCLNGVLILFLILQLIMLVPMMLQ